MRDRVFAVEELAKTDLMGSMSQAKSLLAEVETSEGNDSKGTILHLLAKLSKQSDQPADAIQYYEMAYSHHLSTNQSIEAITDLTLIGELYFSKGEYLLAKDYLDLSHKTSTEIGYQYGIARADSNIGSILFSIGKLKEAIQYFYNALKYYESIDEKKQIYSCLNNIATVYTHQGDTAQALSFYEQALAIAQSSNNTYGIINLTINIGTIYYKNGDFGKAMEYFQTSREYSLHSNDQTGLITANLNIGEILMSQAQYPQAMDIFSYCLNMAKDMKTEKNEIIALSNMGECLKLMGDTTNAEHHLLDALSIAARLHAVNQVATITKLISEIYESMGNSTVALSYFKQHTAAKDEIINIETARTIEELKTKYDVDRKEKAAELNRIRNTELKEALEKLELEKQKTDSLLLNILPADVADELKIEGKVKARHYPIAAVMFIDIRNFTVHSMSMSPEILVTVLDEYFCLIDDTIESRGLEKIKTIGDAYLCVAGIPEPIADCALQIVRAAIEIRDSVEVFNTLRATEGKPVFEFRFGIHTGPVVAGVVGRLKFEYDIWGDTVNTAARMEQSGEPSKINISGEVYALIKDHIHCTYRGKQEAKNKGLTDMYFVEEERLD